MVITNLLAGIAFTIISNFTQVVEIPGDAYPKEMADLAALTIGSPYSELDVYMRHKKGTEFWIREGALQAYCSPGSYFYLQDPSLLSKFTGTTEINTNQLIDFAKGLLNRLSVNGKVDLDYQPTVRIAGDYRGSKIPFLRITWKDPTNEKYKSFGYKASIEIDARSMTVTHLDLRDPFFVDENLFNEMKKVVLVADPPKERETTPLPRKRNLPVPTKEQAHKALGNWIDFCVKLSISPLPTTNNLKYDWDRSFVYTDESISLRHPIILMHLENGATFQAIEGTVFTHSSPNNFYNSQWQSRTKQDLEEFKGDINFSFEEVAEKVNKAVSNLGIDKELRGYKPTPRFAVPPVGTREIKWLLIEWRKWPGKAGFLNPIAYEQPPLGYFAEVDLEHGEMKCIAFCDAQLIEAIKREQSK